MSGTLKGAPGWSSIPLGDLVRDLTAERLIDIQATDDVHEPTIASATHTISLAAVRRGVTVKVTRRVKLEPGDLVFSRLHTQNGAFAYCDRQFQATTTFLPLAVDSDKVDLGFLFWALHLRVPSLSASDTVGRETYKPQDILALTIPCPPVDEQKRILERIEKLTSVVAMTKMLRDQTVSDSQILFSAALRDTRERLLRRDFKLAPLGTLTRVTSGGTPSRENPSYWGGTIPWIKTGELLDGDITSAEEHITEEGLAGSSARLFPKETVLIALYGQGQTRGRTGRLLIEAATNQACCAILPKPDILEPRFVQYWLRSLYYEMRELNRAGAQPNWNGGMIKEIEIALPPLGEQKRIISYLDSLEAKVNALEKLQSETAAELHALKPAILDKAFKGEL